MLMKPRMTLEECESLIQLLKSGYNENVNLACQILLSKSYKTTPILRTAVYNARCVLNQYKKRNIRYSNVWKYLELFIISLKRYRQKLIHYGNQ